MKIALKKMKLQREKLNYSQEYVAFKLGISQSAYAKIELGITKLNLNRLEKICKIFNIHYFELIDRQGSFKFPDEINNTELKVLFEELLNQSKESNEKVINTLEEKNKNLIEKINSLISSLEKKQLLLI